LIDGQLTTCTRLVYLFEADDQVSWLIHPSIAVHSSAQNNNDTIVQISTKVRFLSVFYYFLFLSFFCALRQKLLFDLLKMMNNKEFRKSNISPASCVLLLCLALDAATSVQAFVPSPQPSLLSRPAVIESQAFLSSSSNAFQYKSHLNQRASRGGVTSSSSLHLVATPATATVAAITGAITGGVFAGALHAIAGMSHKSDYFAHD